MPKGKQTTKKETLHDLLLLKLAALHDIELELVKALPKMAEASTDPDLKNGFKDHLAETKNQVIRIEEAFTALGEKPEKTKVEAIRGLTKDAAWIMKHIKNPEALDAALIASASYVEHYEMAGYRSAIEWARKMGHDEVIELLSKTLDEEKTAEEKLSDLAKSKINEKANMV